MPSRHTGESWSIALPIIGCSGWVASATFRQLYLGERLPVPIVQEDGWASQPARMCQENLANPVVRTPDRLAHSELLRRPFFKLAQAYIYKLFFFPGRTHFRESSTSCGQVTDFVLLRVCNSQRCNCVFKKSVSSPLWFRILIRPQEYLRTGDGTPTLYSQGTTAFCERRLWE